MTARVRASGDPNHGGGDGVCSDETLISYGSAGGESCHGGGVWCLEEPARAQVISKMNFVDDWSKGFAGRALWLPAGGRSRWLTATWIGGIAVRVCLVSLLLMLGFWAYYFVRACLVVGGPAIFIFYLFIKPGEGPSV